MFPLFHLLEYLFPRWRHICYNGRYHNYVPFFFEKDLPPYLYLHGGHDGCHMLLSFYFSMLCLIRLFFFLSFFSMALIFWYIILKWLTITVQWLFHFFIINKRDLLLKVNASFVQDKQADKWTVNTPLSCLIIHLVSSAWLIIWLFIASQQALKYCVCV